mgnify:CR=1 FL=1
MSCRNSVQRFFALGALILALYPSGAQSQAIQEGFSPDNYDTQIAKDILKALNDPASLKKVVVTFVNTSKAPLMCKMEVMPVYEQHMRSIANNQYPEVNKMLAKEFVIRLKSIDEYCAVAK